MHVVYGIPALKTHAKCVLVVRREGDGVRHYVHIGTGNYNPKTARIYTDLGLFTADPEIGADIAEMFNYADRLRAPARATARCWSRRSTCRRASSREIERTIESHSPETAGPDPAEDELAPRRAVDPGALPRLAGRASRCELNVRGICALRPGVPGVSDEHRGASRSSGASSSTRGSTRSSAPASRSSVYIGSADLMPRNLYNRVELVAPIDDDKAARRAARRARPLARRQHQRLGARAGRRLDAPPARTASRGTSSAS